MQRIIHDSPPSLFFFYLSRSFFTFILNSLNNTPNKNSELNYLKQYLLNCHWHLLLHISSNRFLSIVVYWLKCRKRSDSEITNEIMSLSLAKCYTNISFFFLYMFQYTNTHMLICFHRMHGCVIWFEYNIWKMRTSLLWLAM